MKSSTEKCREFHVKHRFAFDIKLNECNDETTRRHLVDAADTLSMLASELEGALHLQPKPDIRLHRVQLMVEELSEVIDGLLSHDEVAVLDGLSDLEFVTIGTGLTFALPLADGLNEVCESNLTKDVRKDTDPRLRDKGPNFKMPRLKLLLKCRNETRKVMAQRSHSVTSKVQDVEVTLKVEYYKSLNKFYINIVDGVTGYEGASLSALKEQSGTWSACAGTRGRWDRLVIPETSMQKIKEWIKELES